MLIENQTVTVKWQANNSKHFKELGYIYTNFNDPFDIKVTDLSKSSKVKVKCDYCNEIYDVVYNNYNRQMEKSFTKKYACKKCMPLKNKETNLLKYGVESPIQNDKIKEKIKQTCLEKYGVDNAAKPVEVKQKIIQTNLNKYGTKYGLSNKSIRNKIKQTCLKRYGVENVFQFDEVKEKIKQTNLKNYGYENNLNHPEERAKALAKGRQILYKENKVPYSKQQKYLHKLFDGELNYPVGIYSLDIALVDEMIYIEYDGGGHDLSVKFGKITREKFNENQIKRDNFLLYKGWKIIRIKSKNDYLPDDNTLISLINEAKKYLNNQFWFEIDIDNEVIFTKIETKQITLNNLRRL